MHLRTTSFLTNELILIAVIGYCLILPDTVYCQVQGYVKSENNTAIPFTRIVSDDGYTTCSDANGWYSVELQRNTSNSLTFRKKGFKTRQIPVVVNASTQTIPDIYLEYSLPAKEITGFAGIKKEGIQIRLYKLTGNIYPPNAIDAVRSCQDGVYSFPELTAGTYKIVPECSVCTFNPLYYEGIVIPDGESKQSSTSIKHSFLTTCNAGACY